MRAGVLLSAAALLVLVAAEHRLDQDFEFDDAPEAQRGEGGGGRRARRYTYEPHNPLCRTLVCKKREVCLLRDSYTALCAIKKDVLRRGDIIVASAAGVGGVGGAAERGDDEDVFYEARAGGRGAAGAGRCAGCGGAARAAFLCGSDNRTYSSLCRLDLHNCVRRARPPVRFACRGFCPCTEERRRRLTARTDVAAERSYRRQTQATEGCALDKMADRLLDWFYVLMDEATGVPPPPNGYPRGCQPEVRWMFEHLDVGGDRYLSSDDLYALRHDERERCLRPFLASCGGGAAGAGVSRRAWCGCMRRAARPCAALARAHPAPQPGAYVPACDARGYYRPRQCHSALGVCWCVNAHGVEEPGSRTKGAPPCPGVDEPENNVSLDGKAEAEAEAEAEAGAGGGPDDEDAGGSGDGELHF